MAPGAQGGPETVGAALLTVVRSGHQLLESRIELALHDGQRLLRGAVVELALVLFGGLLVLGGLVTLDVALVDRLRQSDAGWSAVLVAAAAHTVVGAGLLLLAVRRRRAGAGS